jgi:hypothetical protein
MRYWHIVWDGYTEGEPLLNRNKLLAEGFDVPWKWEEAEEGFDGDVICLFPDDPDGRRDADWMWSDFPSYLLLRVDLPDWWELIRVEEGYPAVCGVEIPAEYITVVAYQYQEGLL